MAQFGARDVATIPDQGEDVPHGGGADVAAGTAHVAGVAPLTLAGHGSIEPEKRKPCHFCVPEDKSRFEEGRKYVYR
ncbi:hypothetical protein MMAD_45290 [Mycolicibacterium madagascariense]|uniref:Uncharacterized protein n=1 Tax=Mycolicibacterium madagascariense TaxID=212765 RepID=A0A7I7XLY9_9MYCO|nr:hypothetical protein MMAD_45290 [Mycolicibacterium madagascariense]